ncbi:Tox-REase-5 domain-containing protein [Caldimonas sp.]|uniref:Tox-REase-5 domain-containing protein n=1 Tax=Caldimonas sp. TaxID=2838790 RepID=UPI00391C8E7D
MAAAAIPLIEAAAIRILTALGVGVAAGAAGEVARQQARKRQEQADQAKDSTIARAEAPTRARQTCKECPPDRGEAALQSTAGWSLDSIDYQRRIGQMPAAPEGYLVEWQFNGVRFDGFDSSQCLLKEAKARYDQFFDEWGGFQYPFQERIFVKMTNEAVAQNRAAIPKPPIRLQWNFMEPVSYRYMSKVLLRTSPEIEVLYRP